MGSIVPLHWGSALLPSRYCRKLGGFTRFIAKEVVNFGWGAPFNPDKFGAPVESVLTVLSDCFPVQICTVLQVVLLLIRKMLLLWVMGRLSKAFIGFFLCSHIFEGQENVSFLLGSILMPLFPCIGDSISEKNISWLAWGSSCRI